jgi:hypothetical protein
VKPALFAFHEAGHAVVAAAMHYDVYQINTCVIGTGAVWYRVPDAEDETPDGRCRLLSVDTAGRVAESIARGDDVDVVASFIAEIAFIRSAFAPVSKAHALASGLEGDDVDAALHLEGRSDDEVRAELAAAVALARAAIVANWTDVEKIAGCLSP